MRSRLEAVSNSQRPAAAGLGLLVATVTAGTALPVFSQEAPAREIRHELQIDAQPVSSALKALAAQTGLQVLVFSQDANNKRSPAVRGNLTNDAALLKILGDRGLTYQKIDDNTVAIRRADATPAAATPSNRHDSSSSAAAAAEDAPKASDSGPRVPEQKSSPNTEETPQDAVQEIVVTGTRIARPNLEGTSPVTVVDSATVKLSGSSRVEDIINELPQALAGQSSTTSMGANGTATVNLRGLGVTRTLVLINGRRLVPGDPVSSPVADLNSVPVGLIKRVDVLTGGASATYGADAVAGVVNFILDDKFTGLSVNAQYSSYQHTNDGQGDIRSSLGALNLPDPEGGFWGGGVADVSLLAGTPFADGRGHFTAYGGYRKSNPIYQRDYNYSACSLAEGKTGFSCGGSGTTGPGGQFIAYTDSTLTHQIDANPTAPGNQAFTVNQAVPGGEFIPYATPRDLFNTAPYNYFQRNDVRYTAGGFGEFEFSAAATAYEEFSYMNDSTNAVIAPSGIFSSATYTTPCSNPLMSTQEAGSICPGAGQSVATMVIGRRNIEGGGRNALLDHISYRGVLGLRGDINSRWKYDIYGQYSVTDYNQVYYNEFSKQRIQRALNVVSDPRAGSLGQPVCTSVLDGTDPACVPYDLFIPGGVSSAALSYLQQPLHAWGHNIEQVVSGSVTGDLGDTIKSPWSTHNVGIAGGAEYRSESLMLNTDEAFQTGDGAGQNALLPQEGSFNVKELFGELHVPILENSFVQRVAVDAGYRYSYYSTAGSTNTYKFGLEVAPIQEVTFRGSYNRAVRAPNIVELFAPQRTGTFNGIDPCASAPGQKPLFNQQQCAFEGVSAAQYGNIQANTAGQYQSFGGGDANLKPEVADTYTVGVVLQPRGALHGLTVTADYYDIRVHDIINTVGPQILLNLCGQTGDPVYCSTIHREPGTGSLYLSSDYYVDDRLTNIGKIETAGVDIGVHYQLNLADIGWNAGEVRFNFDGSYLNKFIVTPGTVVNGVDSYDCAGLYGGTTCGTTTGGGVPRPKWRHLFRTIYSPTDKIQLAGTWRYIGGVDAYTTSDNPFLAGTVFPVDAHLGARSYLDLNATLRAFENLTFSVGVNNVFDRDPPLVGSAIVSATSGNGNTYPGVYDALGRNIYVSVSAKF